MVSDMGRTNVSKSTSEQVLILVLMEDGLWLNAKEVNITDIKS